MKSRKARHVLAFGIIALMTPLLLGGECDSSGSTGSGVVQIVEGVFALVIGILQLVL